MRGIDEDGIGKSGDSGDGGDGPGDGGDGNAGAKAEIGVGKGVEIVAMLTVGVETTATSSSDDATVEFDSSAVRSAASELL